MKTVNHIKQVEETLDIKGIYKMLESKENVLINPFEKYSKQVEIIKLEILGKPINQIHTIIEKEALDLHDRNKSNCLVFAFLVDCLRNKYRITEQMIVRYFEDHGLNKTTMFNNLSLTGNREKDILLRIIKHEPSRLSYSTCGRLVVLKSML